MIHTNNNTIALAILSLAVTALVLTSYYAYAQSIQSPEQQQQLPNIPPPQLPPGAVVIPPSQQHGPPLAQIQSDIARHQEGSQYAAAKVDEFNHRLGNDTSTAHAIQVLKQMTAEGKINCPTPFTIPGHCFLTPKPVGIAHRALDRALKTDSSPF